MNCLLLAVLLALGCSDDKNDGTGNPDGGTGADSGTQGSGSGGDGDGDGDGSGDGDGDGDGSGDGDGDGDGSGDGDGDGDGAGEPSTPLNPTGIVDDGWDIPPELLLCGDRACACADGMDNDGDGTADGFDTECTGPNDDDEGSFATGISGDNMDPKWQDCFFDGNSGGGDDGCRYATECLTGELEQTHRDCTLTHRRAVRD
jgi:hypothetical protein